MSRNICNLYMDKTYKGNDIGRAIESWCIKNHIDCPGLTHGKINDELRRCGIKPIETNGHEGNGYRETYRGSDVIPFVKDYIEKLKASKKSFTKQISIDSLYKQPKKRKAKPESSQTSQPVSNDAMVSGQHQTSDVIIALIKVSKKLETSLREAADELEASIKDLEELLASLPDEEQENNDATEIQV